jgi:hypothetical protein
MIYFRSKVKCGVRGDTGPACNAGGMIDRTILGIQHLYRKPIYARTKVISPPSVSFCFILVLLRMLPCYFGFYYSFIINADINNS